MNGAVWAIDLFRTFSSVLSPLTTLESHDETPIILGFPSFYALGRQPAFLSPNVSVVLCRKRT